MNADLVDRRHDRIICAQEKTKYSSNERKSFTTGDRRTFWDEEMSPFIVKPVVTPIATTHRKPISLAFLDEKEDPFNCGHADYNPVAHIHLKKPFYSRLQYKIIDASEIPFYLFRVVVEVPVRNGLVLGTECIFNQLLKNERSPALIDSLGGLVFKSRKQFLVIERPRLPDYHFDIIIRDLWENDLVIMKDMDVILWNRLTEFVTVFRLFHDSMKVEYFLPKTEVTSMDDSLNPEPSIQLKKIELSVTLYHYLKSITAGMETLQSFRSLSSLDQLILLKNGVTYSLMVFSTLLQDRKNRIEVYSAFDDNLMFGIDWENMRCSNAHAEDVFFTYFQLLDKLLDFIQKDAFAVTLIAVIFFFQDYDSITDREKVNEEKRFFIQILRKYIEGKISSGHWTSPIERIIENIDSLEPLLFRIKESYVSFSGNIERQMMYQHLLNK